jgi:uncharacterized membrane protein YkoI
MKTAVPNAARVNAVADFCLDGKSSGRAAGSNGGINQPNSHCFPIGEVVVCRTMKAKRGFIAVALLFTLGASAAEERLTLDQVPSPVREAIRSAEQKDPVKEIRRRVHDGQTVYEVEFERNNAPNPHLRLAEDGSVIRPLPLTPAADTAWPLSAEYPDLSALIRSPLTLDRLPAAVQEAVRSHSNGREIADIDEERWTGQTVYEIEFKERGRNPRIHVAADGTVVRDERDRRGLKSVFMGTQLADTPHAVQETARRVIGDREIVDIDRRGPLNRSVYLVVVRNTNGLETLHIAEDGKLLQGSPEGTTPAQK